MGNINYSVAQVNSAVGNAYGFNQNLNTFPVIAMFGGSRVAGGNNGATITSITLSGTAATITCGSSHFLNVGMPIFIDGALVGGAYETAGLLNGVQVVASVTSSTVFTISTTLTGTVTADTNGMGMVNDWRMNDANIMMMAMARLKQPAVVINRGTVGQTTARMVSRFARDITTCKIGTTSYTPNIIFIRGPGINDVNGLVANSTIQANIASIVSSALALPQKPLVVLSTILPVTHTNSTYSTAKRDARLRLNDWIRTTYSMTPGVVIFDEAALTTDSTGSEAAYAGWRSGYSTDGLHPNQTESVTISANLATLMGTYVPTSTVSMVDSTQDTFNTSNSARQLLTNPLMAGSTAASGTGISGNVATGISLSRSGTPTIVATTGVTRSDGIGYDQKYTVTSTADNDRVVTIFDYINGYINTTNTYRLSCHFKATSTVNMKNLQIFVDLYDGTNDNYINCIEASPQGGGWPNGTYDLVFYSPIFNVPNSSYITSNDMVRADVVFSGAGGDGSTTNLFYFGKTALNIIS